MDTNIKELLTKIYQSKVTGAEIDKAIEFADPKLMKEDRDLFFKRVTTYIERLTRKPYINQNKL